MYWWDAVILGIVEGVTEFLPVSSTGHLLFVQALLKMEAGRAANAFAIVIQGGAIAAVLAIYWARVKQILLVPVTRDPAGIKLARNLIVAFLPAAVIGLLFDDMIEQYLFGLWPIVTAWFVGGLVILWVERRREKTTPTTADLLTLTWQRALIIGFAQCIAMWPGTSRSLATILAGVLAGLSMPAAVEFSFLLGLITLGAATAYKAVTAGGEMISAFGLPAILIGFTTSSVAAFIAVKWMVAYLNRRGMHIFAVWRIGLAIIVGGMLLGQIIA